MLIQRLDQIRLEVSPMLDPNRRSKLGQFMTPGRIAADMAAMFDVIPAHVRLLDAGAGMGALTAAFVAEACARPERPRSIDATCYEIDPVLVVVLEETLDRCAAICREHGVAFTSRVISDDYILHSAEPLLQEGRTYTNSILNPPYKKLNTGSSWRMALRTLGIETVNLYAAFVAVALQQMEEGGELVAITPRSFCNGPYYEPFRRQMLTTSALLSVHVFESRRAAFKDDDVLQENVIYHLRKDGKQGDVRLSTDATTPRRVPFSDVVRPSDPHLFIRLAVSDDDTDLAVRVQALPCTLGDLGVTVSTGRVVDFRAREHLRKEPGEDTVPLIYPGHFDNGRISWPVEGFRKYNALADNDETKFLQVPAGTYVLTKRFSAKEEKRRLVAAVYDGPAAGFENHLNYFHRKGQGLDPVFAAGLAAFLNSTAVDLYFRQFSGHTQVNATDLRNLHYPSQAAIELLGRSGLSTQEEIDAAVEALL
mgnify:CR=1 FL=1